MTLDPPGDPRRHGKAITQAGFEAGQMQDPYGLVLNVGLPGCATALMMLLEAGKVDLDTPIRAYLPDFRLSDEDVAARVTLKHLLTHTGGWLGDYFNDFGFGDDAQAKMLNEIAKLPRLTPLGEVWSYCNTGFNIAGRLIEVVTGRSYEAAIKELILDPLGMKLTFFFPHDVMTYRFAVQGNVRIYPAGALLPLVSTVNYVAGQTRANNASASLNALGQAAVRCSQASGSVHVVLDVNGYFE